MAPVSAEGAAPVSATGFHARLDRVVMVSAPGPSLNSRDEELDDDAGAAAAAAAAATSQPGPSVMVSASGPSVNSGDEELDYDPVNIENERVKNQLKIMKLMKLV